MCSHDGDRGAEEKGEERRADKKTRWEWSKGMSWRILLL